MNFDKGDSAELTKSIKDVDLQGIQPNNTSSYVDPKKKEVINIILQYIFGKIN